ncbi:MAG: osmoprotectant NAGGN system M42 family peptidase [Pseudomonadota bacterium]
MDASNATATLPAIDEAYLTDQLAALIAIPSPTGFTDGIARHVAEELQRLGVAHEITRRGAIRARLPGRKSQPARAIISHLDTLGAQVKAIRQDGRLEVVPIGHWSARFAEGARVTIFADPGTYRGTILPPKASGHAFGDEVDEAPVGWPHVQLRVDAFAENADDIARLGIEVGDIVAIDPQPEFLDNGFIVSRHLDNKAGVAVMLAAVKALMERGGAPTVTTVWLFSISEEVGHGASHVLTHDIASMVVVDNGCTAFGQNSRETGVTISMGDMTGPFDFHTTRKLIELCRDHDIPHQRDVFRHYRSDSASAIEAGADVRTALATFGVDASHGYERIHVSALTALSTLLTAYTLSPVDIPRDANEAASLDGFPDVPFDEAPPIT